MQLEKRYQPETMEPALQADWQEKGVYEYDPNGAGPVYAIDTPPPTVSGKLHLGHVYSYSHVDFMARYFRMKGYNIFYPMGFDDNGLPTEQLVERRLGKRAQEVGREAFINACLAVSDEEEAAYEALWRRLGLSIDWRFRYRTIDKHARRIAQRSFVDLFEQGRVYQKEAPTIWCPRCQTAIAQADLVDIERDTEFVRLRFDLVEGGHLDIATTRPELLPACVAVFVHPEDARFEAQIGKTAVVPIYGQQVPVIADPLAEPEKGTGVVMCCTFGDQTDILWWRTHDLPLIEAISPEGRMTAAAGEYEGLLVKEAQEKIKEKLTREGFLVGRTPTSQSVRAHERDDVPVEYLTNRQWFIRILDDREKWLELGEKLIWHPDYMKNRYISWVENLNWDWCISRQRYYGVPFPLWYCAECREPLLASPEKLPIDPLTDEPDGPCPKCGCPDFIPEEDVLDTWATSSMSPQIVTRWLEDDQTFKTLFPMTLRPQAHEIIRTWTFYTIVKSYYHFKLLPWDQVLISGWGIAGEGMGKISKSKGGGPMPPMAMLEKYSADAVRYWAASAGTGKDAVINEEKVKIGQKLVNKLWNLARFSERFLSERPAVKKWQDLSGGDRWILSTLQDLINQVSDMMDHYDYAFAKNETEKFLWIFADNYLEMAKGRLYGEDTQSKAAAEFTLRTTLLAILKLLAPFMPHVTEKIYLDLFSQGDGYATIHASPWPAANKAFFNRDYFDLGESLIAIASAVRRFKSDQGLSLGTGLTRLALNVTDPILKTLLKASVPDLISITRAAKVEFLDDFSADLTVLSLEDDRLSLAAALSSD